MTAVRRVFDLLLQAAIVLLATLVVWHACRLALPPPPPPPGSCVTMHSLRMLFGPNISNALVKNVTSAKVTCAALDCFRGRLERVFRQRNETLKTLREQLERLKLAEEALNASEELLSDAASAEVALVVGVWKMQQIQLRRQQLAKLLSPLH